MVRVSAWPGPGRIVPTLSVLAVCAVLLNLVGGPVSAGLLCSLPMAIVFGRAIFEWLVGMTLVVDVLERRVPNSVLTSADSPPSAELVEETTAPIAVSPETPSERQVEVEAMIDRILSVPLRGQSTPPYPEPHSPELVECRRHGDPTDEANGNGNGKANGEVARAWKVAADA